MRTFLLGIVVFGLTSLVLGRTAGADDVAEAYRAMKRGAPDAAIAHCDRAIQADPGEYGAYNNRSWAYYVKGNYDQAVVDATTALSLDPDPGSKAVAHINRGAAQLRRRNLDRAVADASAALALEPDARHKAMAYTNRGAAYIKKRDFEKARADLDMAIALDPGGAEAYFNRAAINENTGRYGEALADYQRAAQLDPGDPDACNGAAWCLAASPDPALRDGRRAWQYAAKAVQLKPTAKHYATLAAAYAECGDFDQAVEYQKRALAGDNQAVSGAARLRLYEQRRPYRLAARPESMVR